MSVLDLVQCLQTSALPPEGFVTMFTKQVNQHKEILQCKPKLPTRNVLASFIRKL